MVKEAEKYREADKRRKEEVELRNQADSLVYTSEKTINELGEKISKDQREKVEQAREKLKKSLEGKDIAKIKEDMDALTKALHEISAVVYQEAAKKAQEQAQAQGQGQEQTKDKGKEDTKEGERGDYVDVDYDVKDEKKR